MLKLSSCSNNKHPEPKPCRFADPPIVCQRKGSTSSSAPTNLPSHNKFADPPLVYTGRHSEAAITPTTPSSAAPPDIGMAPITSNALVSVLPNTSIPANYMDALTST